MCQNEVMYLKSVLDGQEAVDCVKIKTRALGEIGM